MIHFRPLAVAGAFAFCAAAPQAQQAVMMATIAPGTSAYMITRTFWENADAARVTPPWMSDISLDYAIGESGMPLHPGALRYYEEIGSAIPEGSRAI